MSLSLALMLVITPVSEQLTKFLQENVKIVWSANGAAFGNQFSGQGWYADVGISRQAWNNPPVRIGLYRVPETILEGKDGMTKIVERNRNNFCDASNASIILFAGKASGMSSAKELATNLGNNTADVVERSAKVDVGAGGNVQGVYYDDILANPDAYKNGGWRSKATKVAESKSVWAGILSTTNKFEDRVNEVFTVAKEADYNNVDGWDDETKKKAFGRYLDMLMTLYTIAETNPTVQAQWGQAIDDYVNNVNVETTPVTVVMDTCAVMSMGASGYYVFPTIDYINFVHGVEAAYAINGEGWKGSSMATEAGGITQKMLTRSISESIKASPTRVRGSDKMDENNGFSWGRSYLTKSICFTTGGAVSWRAKGLISEGIINTISLEQGVSEDTGPVGFGLFPAPIVGIPSGFAHFRAEPDDKPVESEAIGEPAVLTISSSIPEDEFGTWVKIVSDAKKQSKSFEILITMGRVNTSGDYGDDAQYSPYIERLVWSPDKFQEFVYGKEDIVFNDLSTASKEFNGRIKQEFMYTCQIKVRRLGDTDWLVEGGNPDPASWIHKPDREIWYTSMPEAYSELKNYGEGSDMSGYLTEDWEAMAGVPSTEQLYFAAGGSEFIVDVTLEYVENEVAKRTFDSYWTSVDCEYKESDIYSGGLSTYPVTSKNGEQGTVTVTVTGGNQTPLGVPGKSYSAHGEGSHESAHITGSIDGQCGTPPIEPDPGPAPRTFEVTYNYPTSGKKYTYKVTEQYSGGSSSSGSCSHDPDTGQCDKGGFAEWDWYYTYSLPLHALCGPCCEHVLPEIHDTWAQTWKYDSLKISDVHVWRIDQAAVTGLNAIVAKDIVAADIVTNEPVVFFNIALKNDAQMVEQDGKGGATGTSKAGRVRYVMDINQYVKDDNAWQHDEVTWNNGVRSNVCNGLNTNPGGNSISGHSEGWPDGIIYEGMSPSTGIGHLTYPTNVKNFLPDHTDAIDKKDTSKVGVEMKEYKTWYEQRNTQVQATMITDFLILDTTSGNQSVMYFHKDAPNKVTNEEEIPELDVTKEEMWDSNSMNASDWEPEHINVGGYNGNYQDIAGKFDGSGRENISDGATFFEPDPAKTIIKPAGPTEKLMLYEGELNITLQDVNKAYYTEYAQVFWANALHWSDASSKFYTDDPPEFTGGAPYGADVKGIGREPNETWFVNYENHTFTYNGESDARTANHDPEGLPGGHVLNAPYSPSHKKINDIIVHDPVSTEFAFIESLPDERDQRTDGTLTGGSKQTMEDINNNKVCPRDPALCDFRHLNCTYFKDTVLASFNFENAKVVGNQWLVTNDITKNQFRMPTGFTVENGNKFSTGKYLNARGIRWEIPFSELHLDYSPTLNVQVEADIILEPSNKNTMIFSFYGYSLYLPANSNKISFNTGNGIGKQANKVVADGQKHNIKVIFNFYDAKNSSIYVDGALCTYDRVNENLDITSIMIGKSFYIGSWGNNTSYSANFWLDNLKITRLKGTDQHTDACYRLEMMHPEGLNYHNHTVACLDDLQEEPMEFNYTGSVQEVFLEPGIYKFEAWGASGGGNEPGVNTAPTEYEYTWVGCSNHHGTGWGIGDALPTNNVCGVGHWVKTGNVKNQTPGSQGGKGGYAQGLYSIAKGTNVQVYVGGKGESVGNAIGGWNGGGAGNTGASGGGGTDIRVSSTETGSMRFDLNNKLVRIPGTNEYPSGTAVTNGTGQGFRGPYIAVNAGTYQVDLHGSGLTNGQLKVYGSSGAIDWTSRATAIRRDDESTTYLVDIPSDNNSVEFRYIATNANPMSVQCEYVTAFNDRVIVAGGGGGADDSYIGGDFTYDEETARDNGVDVHSDGYGVTLRADGYSDNWVSMTSKNSYPAGAKLSFDYYLYKDNDVPGSVNGDLTITQGTNSIWQFSEDVNGGVNSSDYPSTAIWRHLDIDLPSDGNIKIQVDKAYYSGGYRYNVQIKNIYLNGVRLSCIDDSENNSSGMFGGANDGTGGAGGGLFGDNGTINGTPVVGVVMPGENAGIGGLGGTQDGGYKQWQGEPSRLNGDAGAGGGGYWGGLASTDYNGGGGGGSSYIDKLGAGSTESGVNWGNGKVVITKLSGAGVMADAINGGLFDESELRDILGEAYDPIMADAYGKLIYSWKNWTNDDMLQFYAKQQCNLSTENGNLVVNGTGSDSRVAVPVNFQASGVEKIEVIMDNASTSTRGTLRWTRTDSNSYDATKMINSSVYSANSNNQKFSFIVRGKGQWKGTINNLCFDFINTNGTAKIKAINIYGTGPVSMQSNVPGGVVIDTENPGDYTIQNLVGKYKIEVWGAQGSSFLSGNGGLGGYSSGEVDFDTASTIYASVGGQNGHNGGEGNQPGGGATHVASQPGILQTLENNKDSVFIVAGGGGGGERTDGGAGGGLSGEDGTLYTNGYSYKAPTGGSQTTGGEGGSSSYGVGQPGTFGKGGAGLPLKSDGTLNTASDYGSTGGGGWYGGGGITYAGGAAGGSSYIGGVTNGTTSSNVKAGNGRIKITQLTRALTIGPGEGTAHAGEKWVFDYTGDVQTWMVPASGKYKLSVWGAQGGKSGHGIAGGLGGYSTGDIQLQAGDIVYVYIGGMGGPQLGGFNGGGNGASVNSDSAGGGGASDMRVRGDSLQDRVIVAGGGGGSGCTDTYGGNGGGLLGGAGTGTGYEPGQGGTQTGGGVSGGYSESGSLGKGGNTSFDYSWPGAGGGGGYYGGGAGLCSNNGGGSGGGGSGYIGGVIDGSTQAGVKTEYGYGEIVSLESSLPNRVKPETIRKYWMLLPDYVSTGEINPIWSCKLQPKNEHRCDLSSVPCSFEKVLYCTEPHHKNLHYDSSNPICWEACGNDENHKLYKPVINLADGSYTPGNFINIDYGFRACFPNVGDFYDGEPHGIGALTDQRGLAFVDQMDTTKWTRVKRIKFEWNAIYRNYLYLSNEWIVLGDRGTYTGAPQSKYDEANWTNHGTYLEEGIKQIWYDFYSVLANYEAKAATAEFEVEAVNCPGPNDNKETMNNKDRTSTFTALHGGYKIWYIDVVGRIGNLVIEDVGDYRYSNLFKVPIKNEHGFSITPVTYTPSSGLDLVGNAVNVDGDYIRTSAAGDGVQLGVYELKPGQYRIDILGSGLNNGRLKLFFKSTDGDWIDTREDYTRRIIVSNKQVARYLNVPVPDVDDGEEASLEPREVKIEWVSNNTNRMDVNEITLRYLGEKAESWMLDGIVWEVDESQQNWYMTWINDIRGEAISNKTNYINTYGTRTWMNDKNLQLPLSPDKNNIDILKDEPMLIGYDMYTDISTVGNYYLNNSSRLEVVPYYYAYDLNNINDPLIPLDVYVNHEGSYQPINIFDLVHPGWDEDAIFDHLVNLNWLEENVRRNYTDAEKLRTDTIKDMEEFKESVVLADGSVTGYKQLDAPSGEHYKLGNSQAMVSTGKARTFIGGEATYDTLRNLSESGGGTAVRDDYGTLENPDGGRIPSYLWWKSAQRWHMKLGLPSSAVVVRHGVEPDVDTVKEFASKNYIILCTADIRAVGDTYILKYDQYGHNGRIRVQNEEGTWVTVTLPSNIPPVIGVFSTVKSSMHDIDIVGTH